MTVIPFVSGGDAAGEDVATGAATLATGAGFGSRAGTFPLGMELVVVPLLMLWQARVARQAQARI